MSTQEQNLQKAMSLQYTLKTLRLMSDNLSELDYPHLSGHIDSINTELEIEISRLIKAGPYVQRGPQPSSVQNRVGPAIQDSLFDGDAA